MLVHVTRSLRPLAITFIWMALFGAVLARQDVCEVHRRAAADLKKRTALISRQLAYNARTEKDARTALSDFNQALANPRLRQSVLEEYLGSTVSQQAVTLEEDFGLEWKYEYRDNKVFLLRAVRDEQVREVQRIVYARTHHDELNQQKATVEKQLAYHYNRLAELGCKDAQGGCDGFAGTWKTSFGEMTFTITDDTATASYSFDSGKVKGTLSDGGRVLSGGYTEKKAVGTFQFVLAADGQSFDGRWKRTSGEREPPSGTWEGKCIHR